MPPNNTMPAKSESPKLSNKLTQKLQLEKKKLFSQSSDRPESLHEADIARGNSRESIYSHDDSTDVSSQSSASSLLKDGSQSAKSSPQKITKDGKQARAMSDTNISKVTWFTCSLFVYFIN
ncbi:hypothetical protein DPMN_115655 [Dreissena polymorpha]|uniref:Uncharacterized protein n=1 Tax=Dreissena polymorpha TaxID=45954 RepID=A0A9D4QSN9_DREPO|nr:hypothetical protein DPMN_115655 [Dreissena polymorpha]